MSRTGTNRSLKIAAFTLIEVLAAVVILSIGMLGVVRAYITLANGIEMSAFTVQASYLLKTAMADVEKEAIENPGVSAGTKSGNFGKDYPGFRWEYTSSDVLVGTIDKAKEGSAATAVAQTTGAATQSAPAPTPAAAPAKSTEVVLSKIRLSVMSGNAPEHERSLSLWTYLENYSGNKR